MNDSQDGPANESVESLSDDANDAGSGDRGSDRNPPQERSAIGSDNSDRSGRETGSSKDTKEVIMEATFRALSKHGYKDLRMRDIGEELDLTRQVIHYHFDGKYDLMSSFLEHTIDQYEGSLVVEGDEDPRTELRARVDQCLFGPEFEDFSHWDRIKVYHELYTQAQNDAEHREVFNEHYERVRGNIVEVVEEGIDEGVFRDVDPERMSQLVTDVIHAARGRRISLGHDDAPEETREAIDEFIFESLERTE
ncbi:TetR/AcrR family transcriptional regulator [Halorubrum ezzemoulense]|uniref:TetR/AcrR family transcriptional regulator n=1 Tax=Halorubrum ezzemoulense TaxID=337243 RepID=A0ABT4Z273_HALEZ|nr:TetR/AcrR family transcriptional regulator [Halorubrum ezzemoulense]MDB2244305.1 TetR/AcrR family transcriptional regulator [Halorubrum ezzemoulense]MDB2252249.1 TetR/AcrR family transcriptional regulator [Halorubrum ezzemoulense]MDB2278040.1 TetR/AcrR family transcriptional regulator [Halorubrum ezzemoulense]MDB2286207.1 TetR/AcrR family transcriptional regulator [Halorubrum ezzemoulense]MDB2289667.1 TetR/AcrR family transcriptional regulator [Halorubrum ezzemoulense]